PGRGSWLDFEFDPKDILYFRIDRKKKLPITTILYAIGFNKDKIIKTFYTTDKFVYDKENKNWKTNFKPEKFKRPIKLKFDLIDAKNNKKLLNKGDKLNFIIANKFKEKGTQEILVSNQELIGKYSATEINNKKKENIVQAGSDISEENLEKLIQEDVTSLELVNIDPINKGPYLLETLKNDKNLNKNDALNDIYKILRPGEALTIDVAEEVFKNLYFNKDRYDLSEFGRLKLNSKLDLKSSLKSTILSSEDIVA
ncbi:hypothetical protein JI56_01390, partial [SAR11 cluster bacterium PRT-SC02]